MRERQYGNKVLDKALQVIEALGCPEYAEMSIDELSAALKIPKGTLMPYLGEFERHQWLEQTPERRWRISPMITRFAEGARKRFLNARVEIGMREKEHLGMDSR